MTKAKLHYKCKLCKLIKRDKDLWVQVHNKVLKDKMSQTKVLAWLNNSIEVYNNGVIREKQLPKFNHQNLSNHFKQHIPTVDLMMLEVSRSITTSVERGSAAFDETTQAMADAVVTDGYITELDKFNQLRDMIRDLEQRLMEYNDRTKKELEKNPNKKPSIQEMKLAFDLAQSAISTRQDLLKLKNSSKITESAIKSAVEHTTMSFLNSLIDATEEANTMLRQILPANSSVPDEVISLIRSKVKTNMKSAVRDIINSIIKDFGIK